MALKKLEIKKIIQKKEDQNLSFRVLNLHSKNFEDYLQPHSSDHFCIFIIESGEIELHIEENIYFLQEGMVSVIFPDQIHFVSNPRGDITGKILLFEEVLFCSDILKNELVSYNVNLSVKLNRVLLSSEDFKKSMSCILSVEEIYDTPTLIKKEQARFYIKIFLLSLIESVHGQQSLVYHETDRQTYIQFKKLLNQHYKTEHTVQYYASQLSIGAKKLNTITKRHSGKTALYAIHSRILEEVKGQLLYSGLSHKEIAYDLGFSSPSALNKFVQAKLKETPSQLQQDLSQIYNT